LIHIESVSNNTAAVLITQRSAGIADIVLTDVEGKIIRSKHVSNSKSGLWKELINLAGLKNGLYYLQLLIDKRVEHLQELIVE